MHIWSTSFSHGAVVTTTTFQSHETVVRTMNIPGMVSYRVGSIQGMMYSGGGIGCAEQMTIERRGRRRRAGTIVMAGTGEGGNKDDAPAILVNSCTGKMGHATAEAVLRAGLTLVPYSFTGSSGAVAVGNVGVNGVPVELVSPSERQEALDKVVKEYPRLVVIDYTLPTAVNDNANFYCENGLPFVMGTTGGDRTKLMDDVEKSGVYAVIAPNMGKQIVAFQTMVEMMADRFPGCFKGYTLNVVESHQRTKADTSGTAKAVVASFQKMGLDFKESDIEKVRTREEQISRMHVPESAIDGHAFHTYTLTSPDGSVTLEFKHNVCGRDVYADGTVDAALFLDRQIHAGADQRVYNMIDVLSEGAMR